MRLRNFILLILATPLFKWCSLLFPEKTENEMDDFDLSEALNEKITWGEFFDSVELLFMMVPFLFLASIMSLTGLYDFGGGEKK